MVDINPQYPSDELVDHVFSIEVSVPMNYPEASADFHISSIPLIESLDEVVEIIVTLFLPIISKMSFLLFFSDTADFFSTPPSR